MNKKSLFEFIEAFANSHVGSVRSENQDFFGVVKSDSFQAFFVADGMGGAKGGQVAASECIRKMGAALKSLTVEPTVKELKELTRAANQHIYNLALHSPELRGMGTTMVGLTFSQSRVLMVSVGDSRVYRYRGGKLYQLSVDHTVWNDLVTSGSITPSSDFAQEISHMLTRSMGPDEDVEPDVSEIQVEAGDTYLLCSDGLYNMVTENEMVQALRVGSAGKAIDTLIKLANNGGGKDNITALVIKVKKGAHGVFPSCKEDLPGLRECDLSATRPALQSLSTNFAEVTGKSNGAPSDATNKKEPKHTPDELIAAQTSCGKDASGGQQLAATEGEQRAVSSGISGGPVAGKNHRAAYLIAGSVLVSSMFFTVALGIRQGLMRPKGSASVPTNSCSVEQLTDEQVVLALRNRNLTGKDHLALAGAPASLIALLGSPNCNLSSAERGAALDALALVFQGLQQDVLKAGNQHSGELSKPVKTENNQEENDHGSSIPTPTTGSDSLLSPEQNTIAQKATPMVEAKQRITENTPGVAGSDIWK